MAFIEYIIDIVRNGAAIQQKINAERDATDPAKISPARVIQLNGKPLANDNALPVTFNSSDIGATDSPVATSDTGSFSLNSLLKRLLAKIPALVGGRLPVDGSGVTQPISGIVSVSNFPQNSGSGGGTQYTDGLAELNPVGNVVLGNKAGTLKAFQLDTNGFLQTSISSQISISNFPATQAITDFGTQADAASTVGSLMARLRATLDRVGSFGDAASSSGSVMAQLRHIGDSLNRVSITSPISISASGDSTVIAATAARQIVITSLYFTVDATANITLKNGSTSISGAMPISSYASDQSRIILSTNTAFVLNISATANVRGYVTFYLM